MKKLMTMLFALGFIVTSLLYAQTTEVEKWTIRGDEYFDAKDYKNAIDAYTKVIEIRLQEEKEKEEKAKRNSGNSDFYSFSRLWTGLEINAYLYRGHSYRNLKNYDAAISDYEVVRKNYDPSFYNIYVYLGDAYGSKGDYENASIAYKKYIEKKPGDKSIGFRVDKSNKSDMLFCSVLWEKKLLSDDPKYEKWIQEICDNNRVTRADIESFYKKNRGW